MTRNIHAPILVALLVAAACDTQVDDLGRELDFAALEDADADDALDDGPDGLQGQGDIVEPVTLEVEFEGPCSDAAARTGVAVLEIGEDGEVSGYVLDEMYPDLSLAIAGDLSSNGSFEAVETVPFGECTWTGLIDLTGGIAYGGWDCGYGCAGDWTG